ncbi:mediator of DNA damage checkpoint protein 1 isoform X3 [Ahaetulla prasina]|uniref:mediator of DNA damage checkpoint protein 1 isoform X3 n=1 Tax=Ahaetulla prasina TaxID=499056 RepID=UPI00264786C1|nr:mediator of DNA damage checkpoint protein 1 isoform X3 [Ahaetulla prasina]
MEQTQLLEWDGEGDSTDGSDAARETPKPVGRLHLLSSKYGPEKDFWIYPGENTIGRLESCHVCLPANSVSKMHAVIEVPSSHGPHLLYDQGSMNRTRRQRLNLIPQVRYSLQDGDTLLFGDVGCQYFILVPDTDCDSHDDSMAVPPSQESVEATALAIEETPAPGRRIGFGQVLVQDSDKEEEGEEVINGTGSYLHHASKDESDCCNKNGTEGQASLASFGVSCPSATVVPESDDENGEPLVGGSPCPALRLSFESQEAERSPVENGGGPSSNREDCEGATAEEEGASAEQGLVEGFRLDSDTDVEDENQMGGISEVPASLDPEKRDRGPDMDPDTDLNESSVVAPVVRCLQTSVELGSDTDAEETVESPAVFRLKLPSTSMEKEEDDTDVEAEVENPSVVCPGKREPVPPPKSDCKQLEDNVDNVQLGGKKDDDTDVEEDLDNPESGVNALPPPAHEDVDTDVEDSAVKEETLGRTKNRVVGGHSNDEDVDTDVEDSSVKGKTPSRTKNRVVGGHSNGEDVDTDVEDSSVKGETPGRIKNRGVGGHGDDTKEEAIKSQLENSEDTCPQRTCSSSSKESSTDMEEVPLKRIVPEGHSVSERHGDVVELTKNSDVELEMSYEVGDQSPRDFKKKEPSPNSEQHNLPMLFLGSDTDGEEEAGNPDVESKKSQQVSSAESSKGSRVSHLRDPDIGSQEKPSPVQDKDSDTDAEVTSVGRDKSTAQDSDTDTEDVAPSLLRKPLEEKRAQIIIPGRSQAGGEQLTSSAVGAGVSFKSREDNEDTDAERWESYSADESNTDDELDVSLQATQCYLPTENTSPGLEKAGGITATVSGSDCALEEEPTQAFDFSPPFLPAKRQFSNAPVDDRVEENSELIRKTKNSKKVLVPAQEDPASATPPARELRRSLRPSTTSASPTPVPERRSLRHHGSGAVVASSTPAAPETRRRGLRQLSNASQRMREVKGRPEQPGEEGPRKKARNGDLNAAPVPQSRTRGSQRASRAASKVTEVAKAVSGSSPGAREPTKRVQRAPAPDPGLEGQTERPRTRASKHSSSSSTSVSTPSPKDSGKGAKLGQEPVFTPSSGRRLRRHSPDSKVISQKASSGSRTRRATGPGSPAPKVLFTGVIDEEGERIVAELGGTLAESVFDCTHLVTDRVRRTVKFLCALARGIPIVTLDWLEKSRRNAFFLAPNNFLVRDPEQEKNLRFSLSNSLQKAQQNGALFQGYEIHVTPNVKPEPEHMKDIVKCSGGTLLPRMPRAFKEKRVVVSCPEDLSRCKPAQEAGVPITNAEFILTGILQQTVALEAHRLDGSVGPSPASSPLVPSTRTSKRRAATQTAPAPPSTAKRRR